ncbi:hypothetical protein ZEAMMB73_Zm00001d010229 [Zea mays]|uniref:Uncharacterized protein n=1 Tax=Zea mays TaxID=4577 RepID=A0A1D6FPW4_MAIZE|nr:hypothetical protein ZEAMMB73_Zm00001d010229 [Zea mays]
MDMAMLLRALGLVEFKWRCLTQMLLLKLMQRLVVVMLNLTSQILLVLHHVGLVSFPMILSL